MNRPDRSNLNRTGRTRVGPQEWTIAGLGRRARRRGRRYARLRARWSAGPPEVGRPAPLPQTLGLDGRPLVVSFLRHAGCPAAVVTFRALDRLASLAPEVRHVGVVGIGVERAPGWSLRAGPLDHAELICDPTGELRGLWGLASGRSAHVTPAALPGLARLLLDGVEAHADRGRRGAVASFVIDGHGILRVRELAAHAADLCDLPALSRLARGLGAADELGRAAAQAGEGGGSVA